MNLQFFCPRWGSEDISWNDFFVKAQDAGYKGVEFGVARDVTHATLDQIWELAEKNNMLLIPQHFDTYESDYAHHFDLYSAWLAKMKVYRPIKINSQTGKDFFSFEQNLSLIMEAEKFSQETGISLFHETHRNKFSFAAHIMKDYLQRIPNLKITLDISHWVCVAESFLEGQQEAVDIALQRTEHLHARVGYTEGPQVPDPRNVTWDQALQQHLRWWDVVAKRKNNHNETLTITPEFGPFPYMVPLPETNKPIAHQWDINVYMMQLLRKRYQ